MSLRIVVLGYVVRGPLGGLTWHHMNYLLGFRALGHDVAFVELADDAWSCYDPVSGTVGDDPTTGLRYATQVFDRMGFGDRWAFHHATAQAWYGPMSEEIGRWAESADLLVNVSGVNSLPPFLEGVPIRLLIDTDPLFTQVRHLTDPVARTAAGQHNRFATFGESIPRGQSAVPDDGFHWFATRQPISLEHWRETPLDARAPFRTIMQWDSYPPVTHDGVVYGMKSASFEPYMDLPRATGALLSLAIGSPTAPRERLSDHGWLLDDPLKASVDPWRYQEYLRGAISEFSVAKQGYVTARTGWFSERSACFLASGRPVIGQDTGWSSLLPTGEGLFAFATPEQARHAIAEVVAAPRRHGTAARDIAAEYFDAEVVLDQLLNDVGATSRGPNPSPLA